MRFPLALVAVLALAGCAATPPPPPAPLPSDSPLPSAVPSTVPPSPTGCPGPWDCAQQQRFVSAAAFIATVRGGVGIVVRDRVTGAQWTAGAAQTAVWASSTPKLAFALALRETRTLDSTAQAQMAT